MEKPVFLKNGSERSVPLPGSLLKNTMRLKFICSLLFMLPAVLGTAARSPQYGAYPRELRPARLVAVLERIAAEYADVSELELDSLDRELLVDALQAVAGVTGTERWTAAAGRVAALPVVEKTSPAKDVPEPLNLYRALRSAPEGRVADALKQRLVTAAHDDRAAALQSPGELSSLLYIYNVCWGITRPVGMMWLDAYRVPVLRLGLSLVRRTGVLRKPSVSEDAAAMLALCGLYRLTDQMSRPERFVASERHERDLAEQRTLLADFPEPDRAASLALMRRTCEAQLANLFGGSADDARDADRSWYRGTLFAGVMAAWRATGDAWYWNQSVELARRTAWRPGPNALHDGNDLAIAQFYLELAEAGCEMADIAPTRCVLDSLIARYDPRKTEWSWCDALFMSPPVWARMARLTGDLRYLEHMDRLWQQTVALIYDRRESLFYRDLTYCVQEDGFQLRERNGRKICWGRGNGWVLGALCRVMEYMPADSGLRGEYETLFRDMCARMLTLQGRDGLWRASLLDPKSYPMGETSVSAFCCYAMAWGVNHGLLRGESYRRSALRAWRALSACIDPQSGRLGYVQMAADSPRSPVYRTCNVEYAAGAYLLAGSEILELMKNN